MKNRALRSFLAAFLLAAAGVVGSTTSARAGDEPRPAYFEYNFLFGISTGPFDTDTGIFVGANLDVPIFPVDPIFGQTLQGDLLIGWAHNTADGLFSSPNATALALPVAPIPNTEFSLTTFQVVPGAKYKLSNMMPKLGPLAIEPYVVLGVAINAEFSKTDGPGGERPGGIVGLSPELADRNAPVGQGNVLIGGNFGAGVDLFVFENVMLGADFRYNMMERSNASFQTIAGKFGFRFAGAPPPPPPPPPPLPPPAPPSPPMSKVVQTDEQIVTLEPIYFDTNRDLIKPVSEPILDQVAKVMTDRPAITVRVEGHTDSRSSDGYNQKLSERRARSVVKYLAKKGIAESRLQPLGFGESRPVATNDTAEGMAKNRRTEFHVVTAQEGAGPQ